MEIHRAGQAKLMTAAERAELIAQDRSGMGMGGKQVAAGGGTATTAPVKPTTTERAPEEDTGKTWGGPSSTKDLNFGHPTVNGRLFDVLATGRLAFADNGKMLNKDQWANLPAFQQQKLRDLVKAKAPEKLPAFEAAMRGGDASKAHTQPKVDNSQVSPVASAAAEMNQAATAPASVADRARAAAMTKLTQSQSATVQNVSQRINDLAMAKVDLIKDLANPNKAAEAQARIHLLDAQIGDLQQVQSRVQGYKAPANLSAKDAAVVDDTFRQINGEIKNFSDPNKKSETEGVLSVLFSHLDNPALADRRDPVIINQAVAAQNLQQRIDDLVGAKNDLIRDLADPSKQAEAQARMQLVDQQIFQLTDVLNHVEEYRRPANLTADQAAHVAETFNQINTLATDVSNPRKAAAAQGELTRLYADLNTYAATAPVTPVTPTTPTPTPPAASSEVRELQGQFNGLKEQIRALNEQFKAAYGTGNRAQIADLGSQLLKSLQDAQGVLGQLEVKVPEAQRSPKQNQRIEAEKEALIRSQTSMVNFLKALQQ